MSDPILEVENLRVTFPTHRGDVDVVRGVSFSLGRERLGIVGESGSGKSLTGRSIMRLVPPPGRVSATRLALLGHDLLKTSAKEMTRIRGKRIAMILQDPKFSLNPVMKVGHQIEESYRLHADADRGQARGKAIEALSAVRIRDPEAVYHLYPHQLSGGMGQRVMIAMMLMPEPQVLIADEPTSALDVTVQLQVLAILDDLVRERGMSLILISHDLGMVSAFCDRVMIMYAGKAVETINARDLDKVEHPYARGLIASAPRLGDDRPELPVLQRDANWAK
ncbi:ABC transporter ATP-binding protein [Aestuariivirga sp. YIM B02566]|uniref:ABC transporter ATP-binding protein n=1 Tax=Taklimakanibacter albus TaxID=2800327 RepID=A0ACC5QZ90_9HYPH|nr:ABC transporter ATP-binding protein [Aestuariivirga sp. YIM B02566]MBK1865714.1 ABC transporter ATP-binding protein [Aestuariivirga sp. YIM B02566]